MRWRCNLAWFDVECRSAAKTYWKTCVSAFKMIGFTPGLVPTRAVDIAAFTGALVVSYITLSCLLWLLRILRNRSAGGISCFKRPGSWAVVTGASRGIGAEFARHLASRGFNGNCPLVRVLLVTSHVTRQFSFLPVMKIAWQRCNWSCSSSTA